MRLERELKDGAGRSFRVVVYVREQGDVFERAVVQLAAKARDSKSGKATDAFGIVEVEVTPAAGGAP